LPLSVVPLIDSVKVKESKVEPYLRRYSRKTSDTRRDHCSFLSKPA
jgi:hypothetical protein